VEGILGSLIFSQSKVQVKVESADQVVELLPTMPELEFKSQYSSLFHQKSTGDSRGLSTGI
jgi:hypothetical protein